MAVLAVHVWRRRGKPGSSRPGRSRRQERDERPVPAIECVESCVAPFVRLARGAPCARCILRTVRPARNAPCARWILRAACFARMDRAAAVALPVILRSAATKNLAEWRREAGCFASLSMTGSGAPCPVAAEGRLGFPHILAWSAGHPGQRSAGAPAEHPSQRPGGPSAGHPGQCPAGPCAGHPGQRPAGACENSPAIYRWGGGTDRRPVP